MKTHTDHSSKMATALSEISVCSEPEERAASERAKRRFRLTFASCAGVSLFVLTSAVVGLHTNAPSAIPAFDVGLSVATKSASVPTAQQPTLIPSPPASVVREITGSGYVVAPQEAVIYAKHGGIIAEIMVEPGDVVTAGQSLLVIEQPDIRYAAEAARLDRDTADLELAAANIALAQADATLRRHIALNRRDVVASQRLEDARTAFEIARNAVAQAEAKVQKANLALRIAEKRRDNLIVRAPIAGTVTHLPARVGNTVLDQMDAVHDGDGLLTISNLDNLAVDVDVSESALTDLDARPFAEGVFDAFPEEVFLFELQRVSSNVNSAKGTISLRFRPQQQPPGLRPGMSVRIRMSLPSSAQQSGLQSGVNQHDRI